MNLLIFGDSITWGACDDEQGGWANRLRNYLAKQNGEIEVYNLGICGETSADVIARMETECKAREAEMIIFAVGINDTQFIHSKNKNRVSLEEFQNNTSKLLSTAKQFSEKIIFIGLTPVDESKTRPIPWNTDKSYINENIRRFNEVIKNFCEEHHLQFISMNGVLENHDLTDGLHPNTEGHRKMFERVKEQLHVSN